MAEPGPIRNAVAIEAVQDEGAPLVGQVIEAVVADEGGPMPEPAPEPVPEPVPEPPAAPPAPAPVRPKEPNARLGKPMFVRTRNAAGFVFARIVEEGSVKGFGMMDLNGVMYWQRDSIYEVLSSANTTTLRKQEEEAMKKGTIPNGYLIKDSNTA